MDALYSQNSCYIFHVLHNLYVHYTNQLDENPNEDTIEMASIMKSKRAYKDREDEEQIHKKKNNSELDKCEYVIRNTYQLFAGYGEKS